MRLASTEGAVSRQYRCSRWSLCLPNMQAFLPACSMKNPIQTLAALAGATFTSDPTRNACSAFQEVMRLPGRAASWGHLPDTLPCSMFLDRFTPMRLGEMGTFRPGTYERQAGFFTLSQPSQCIEVEESKDMVELRTKEPGSSELPHREIAPPLGTGL